MKRYTFFLLSSIFLFLFSISLTAQKETLFELSTQDLASFSSNEQETIGRLIGAGKTDRITEGWLISFNELKAEEDLSFTLQLPGINRNLEVISEHIGQIEQSILGKVEYTYWTGKIYGPKKYGNFFYVKGSDGAHAGMFQFNGKTFEMLSLNPESGVLREVNHAWAKDVTCGVGVGSARNR